MPERAERSRHSFSVKKLLLIAGVVLLSFCIISIIASAIIFHILFPRQTGVSRFHYSYDELSSPLPRTGFRFRSGGNELQGWKYDAADPKGMIVVVNGIGSGADEHLAEIIYFVDNGWSVITWDATGVGNSGGNRTVGLQQIRSDLEAFLSYYKTEKNEIDPRDLPVMIYSHSAGAYAAAMSINAQDFIRAAVCISGFDRPVELMLHHAKERVGLLANIESPFLRLENLFLFGTSSNDSAREALKKAAIPVLVVNGDSDDLVPWEFSLARDPDSYRNPSVRCIRITSEFRNEHSAPWLSDVSAEYLFNNINGGNAPVDKARASILNVDFMQSIIAFYQEVIS